MTTSLMVRDREEARKKGLFAVGATVGSGVLFWAGAPFLGVGAAAGAAYLTFRWFMFRARRGMRF